MQQAGFPLIWRVAPQPDIVRAAQKDDLYLQQSIDASYDAVMRLFGAIPALQHSKSCKLLATFMYYALTTGAGLQTLGEEYCDIVQLQGQRMQLPLHTTAAQQQQQQQQCTQHQPQQVLQPQLAPVVSYGLPSARMRVLLVLLQTLGPAVLDRLAASLDRASEIGGLAYSASEADHYGSSWTGGLEHGGYSGAADDDDHHEQQARQHSDAALADVGNNYNSNGARPLALLIQASWHNTVQWLAPHWPVIKPWLLFMGRLHLAAFYLNGTYYQWTKRLLGIRYTSISANKEQRASYRVLGLLLVLQLAISAMQQAQPKLSALRRSMSSQLLQQKGQRQQPQHAIVLPEGGSSSAEEQQQTAGAAAPAHGTSAGWGSRHCPLCLSVRTHPTCTPCGHVFCWNCIAQWCTEKPECPLCRTAVVPSQLVCVYHSDF